MRIFPIRTAPVDNFVENLVRARGNARRAGLVELFSYFGGNQKVNEIKAFVKTRSGHLSIDFNSARNAFMCISQVLTDIFLLYPLANARRY
jgi:hypothetical protein